MEFPQLNELKTQSVTQSVESFVINNSTDYASDLTKLSLEELAFRYLSIERQSQIMQGKILMEARDRFDSDICFGRWIVDNGLDIGTQQHRNRLVNLARFFGERDMNGISITAAYEIAAPKNAEIAEKIYEEVRGQNLSVDEVKRKLAVNVASSIDELRVEKKSVSPSRIDKAIINLSVIEEDEDDDEYEIQPFEPVETPVPVKHTLIEASESVEQTIVYVLLAGMSHERKLIVLENCKQLVEMVFNYEEENLERVLRLKE